MSDKLVKIVRDRHVSSTEETVVYRKALSDQARQALGKKLIEEAVEYICEPSIEELADLFEIVRGLASLDLGVSFDEVVAVADEKRNRRGGFDDGIGMFVAIHSHLSTDQP